MRKDCLDKDLGFVKNIFQFETSFFLLVRHSIASVESKNLLKNKFCDWPLVTDQVTDWLVSRYQSDAKTAELEMPI